MGNLSERDKFIMEKHENLLKYAKEEYKAEYKVYNKLEEKAYWFIFAYSVLFAVISCLNGFVCGNCRTGLNIVAIILLFAFIFTFLTFQKVDYRSPSTEKNAEDILRTSDPNDLYLMMAVHYVDMAKHNHECNATKSKFLRWGYYWGMFAVGLMICLMVYNVIWGNSDIVDQNEYILVSIYNYIQSGGIYVRT